MKTIALSLLFCCPLTAMDMMYKRALEELHTQMKECEQQDETNEICQRVKKQYTALCKKVEQKHHRKASTRPWDIGKSYFTG